MIETVLAVDIGTTSLKAGLITAAGEVVSFSTIPFLESDSNKIADEWVFTFDSVLEKFLNHPDIKIKGIAISGNGPTIVSENGVTLRWNEDNSQSVSTKSIFIPRILLFKKRFSEEYKKSKWIFSGPEYLIWKLTGRAVTILPEERYLSAYWTDKDLSDFDIEKEKLPEFVKLGFNCGSTKNGIPVFGIGPDFIAGLIGTDVIENGKICDRCGSSEGINFCIDKEIYAEGIRTLPSIKKGLWNISVLIPESGNLPEDIRLEKVKNAVDRLKNISKLYNLDFPAEMIVTGGQAKNDEYLQKKSELLNMKLKIANCRDAELLGDAKIGWENI